MCTIFISEPKKKNAKFPLCLMRSQFPHFEDYVCLEPCADVWRDKLDFYGDLNLFKSLYSAILQQGDHVPFNISKEASLLVKAL